MATPLFMVNLNPLDVNATSQVIPCQLGWHLCAKVGGYELPNGKINLENVLNTVYYQVVYRFL
jgi:hypothetical protein